MTACAAPIEVLEGILGFVHDDPATLSACSLACHAWMPICRPRLFRKITLDYKGDSCDRFLHTLRSSASTEVPVADCVREVKVHSRSITLSRTRDDARTRLSRYVNSVLENWMPQSVQVPVPQQNHPSSVFDMGDRRPLSNALGPVLRSLPHVERLRIGSIDWNHLAPMTLWEAAMDRTCTSAPLSLFSTLTSVTSIHFELAMFNQPSEVLQLLALFPNLSALDMNAIIFDPSRTELQGHSTLSSGSSNAIHIQKLRIDGGNRAMPQLLHGLLNSPFALLPQEVAITSSGPCDCNSIMRLLYETCSAIEILHLSFTISARMEKLLQTINISEYSNLRIFELEYAYEVWEMDLPGIGHFVKEAGDIRHLPVFLSGLPESMEELVFRFNLPKKVMDGVLSIHWDFTDWDMLDRVFTELHTRIPALRITFYFGIASSHGSHLIGLPVTIAPQGLPDIAGSLRDRLRWALARDMRIRVACFDSSKTAVIPEPVMLSLPQSD